MIESAEDYCLSNESELSLDQSLLWASPNKAEKQVLRKQTDLK